MWETDQKKRKWFKNGDFTSAIFVKNIKEMIQNSYSYSYVYFKFKILHVNYII